MLQRLQRAYQHHHITLRSQSCKAFKDEALAIPSACTQHGVIALKDTSDGMQLPVIRRETEIEALNQSFLDVFDG